LFSLIIFTAASQCGSVTTGESKKKHSCSKRELGPYSAKRGRWQLLDRKINILRSIVTVYGMDDSLEITIAYILVNVTMKIVKNGHFAKL